MEHQFLFLLSRELNPCEARALHNTGFHDCLIGSQKGVGRIDVLWEAGSYRDAVCQARAAFERTIPNVGITEVVSPLEVEP